MTGTELVKKAREHLGEQYVLGSVAPKDNADWDGPWDCAELVSWVVYQTSKILYGCNNNHGDPAVADAFTGFWDRDSRELGIRIPVENAANVPGAAVLRLGGRYGHIVLSDGNGGTIEAHSTARGVIRDTLHGRRWDVGILVPGIQYETDSIYDDSPPPIEPTSVTIYRLLNPNMQGATVKMIQRAMQDRGIYLGPVDGIFGPITKQAVVQLQKDKGLLVDGEVGPQTFRALGLI